MLLGGYPQDVCGKPLILVILDSEIVRLLIQPICADLVQSCQILQFARDAQLANGRALKKQIEAPARVEMPERSALFAILAVVLL